jgi:Undecaprenyl-phosphate glucose phosphotransferase
VLKRRNRAINTILIISDFIAVGLAFVTAYFLRFFTEIFGQVEFIPAFSQYIKILPLLLITFPILFTLNGLYKIRRGKSIVEESIAVFVATIIATLLAFLELLYYRVYYTPDVAPEWEFSRIVLGIFAIIAVLYVSVFRLIIRKTLDSMRRRGINTREIIIAGAGELGRALVDRIIAHEEFGIRAIGFLDDEEKKLNSVYQGVRVIGSLKELQDIVPRTTASILFICLPAQAHHKIIHLIDVANKHFMEVRLVPDLLQYISINASVEMFDGVPIINFDLNPMSGYKRLMKRLFDLAFSLVGLAITAILFPLLALAVKLGGPGPIFFQQERMGMDGKAFTLYKFRTMKIDAESSGPVWAATEDPRATKIGKFMRRTSLDELPQFWNVLIGEMSLVGPRPERPEFVKLFKDKIPKYMLRHKVKAGLTGWAQVNGLRGDTSLEKRIEFDLYYIQNWKLMLDVKIIWLTISRSLFGKSPY